MPFVHVRIAGPALSAEQTSRLQRGVTALMADALSKRAELTAVLVEQVPAAGWSIGGSEPIAVAVHLDAKVTAGTNTAGQKASFIAAAHDLLRDVLGPELPGPTYVVVHEVAADAWGYAGQTQACRAERAAAARSA